MRWMAALMGCALLLSLTPVARAGQVPAGEVSRAIEEQRTGCFDGIGGSAKFGHTASLEEFRAHFLACKQHDRDGKFFTLSAYCSPAVDLDWDVELGYPAPRWVACFATVESGSGAVPVKQDEFRLVTDDGRAFEPSPLAQELGLTFLDLAEPRVVTEEEPAVGLLLFPVPVEVDDDTLLLVWNETGDRIIIDEPDTTMSWEEIDFYPLVEAQFLGLFETTPAPEGTPSSSRNPRLVS